MSEHMWVQESLPLFAAGGLNADERGRVQRHIGQCHECNRTLDEIRELSRQMGDLFAEARPSSDLGETMVQRLRLPSTTVQPRLRRPSAKAYKILAVCASIVVVMVIGGVVSETILNEGDYSSMIKSEEAQFKATRNPPANVVMEVNTVPRGYTNAQNSLSGNLEVPSPHLPPDSPSPDSFLFTQAMPPKTMQDTRDSLDKLEKYRETDGKETSKKMDKELGDIAMGQDKGKIDRGGKDLDIAKGKLLGVRPGEPSADDFALKLPPPQKGVPTPPMSGHYHVPNGVGGFGYTGVGGGGMGGLGMGMPAGPGSVPTADPSVPIAPVPTSPPAMPIVTPTMSVPPGLPAIATAPVPPQTKAPEHKRDMSMASAQPPAPPKFAPFAEVYERKGGEGDNKERGEGKGGDKKTAGEYPLPPAPPESKTEAKVEEKIAQAPPAEGKPKGNETVVAATDAPAQQVQRRIIRTGTIEFEIDSFDVGVATLTKLVIDTKGAFINTVNSEKRPNGKVAGSVVVRMPPEQLDEFVLKLRRDLGKFGELKLQQIGSQDITKQYTDLESQLKASRTMEERLIQIIKEGKGVIKDLLLAEKELGIWRTKIEEIEGTLRYYANQASLSTITIVMVEKELRQAVDLLETERVHAGIEVEDVEKAHKDAIAAVTELKGRISKTELKKHEGGQYNAVVNFEIAPESSGQMRDRLKQLGALARLDVDRVQTSQGGTPARDTKVKRGDSQFFVNIYNLANVAARETIQIRVAVNDVPKAYQAIRDQINKSKARIRDAQVNEQDRENVSAKIDFDANRPDDITVLKAVTDAGEVLFRQLHRRSDDANVTDAKVHIDLQLVNAANIPARETFTLRIAVPDVTKSFTELRDKLAKAKARIINSQMQEQDRLNVTGQIDLDVPRPDDAAMLNLLTDVGEVLSRNVNRRADVANVTDTKVQFNVALVSSANIAAREQVTLRIAVTDVPKAFQQLRDDIVKAKARIVSQVQEQDRQNVFANIDFDVLRPEHTELIKQLSAAGEVITRHVQRQADNPNVTDTKVFVRLELWNVDKVPARDSVILQVAAIDVPKVFQSVRDEIVKAKAKIHTDKLNENDRRNVHAILEFDVQKPENEKVLKTLVDAGEVMTKQAQRRADNESALDSKVYFRLYLVNALTIPARERVLLQVAVADVSKAYAQIRDELSKAKTYVDQSSINETDRQNTRAHLEFAARKPEDARILNVLNDLGEVLSRKEEPNASGENSTDANVAFQVDLVSAAAIQPRETVAIKLEADQVSDKLEQISSQVVAVKGRVYNPKVHHMENGVIVAVVTYDVPLSSLHAIRGKIQASGKVVEQNSTQDPKAPDGKLALARINLTMATTNPLVGKDEGFRSGISSGLSTSVRGLAVSLRFLIVGLLFVVPWLVLLYAGYWLVRRIVSSGKEPPASPTTPASAAGE